jgi:hypothetical protein
MAAAEAAGDYSTGNEECAFWMSGAAVAVKARSKQHAASIQNATPGMKAAPIDSSGDSGG